MAAIAVVIVTHQSVDALPATLGALGPQLREGDEVVVVDNASTDGSPALARDLLPAATVIETGVNLGFAGGCNAGVRASSAPLVLLLNPDCEAQPGCLDALRACADERPGWGAWQALVALPGGETVNTAGNVVHYLGFGWSGGLDRPVGEVAGGPEEVGFVSGAAMVVRRAAWEAAGGFDERYFMYGEDLDLSLRLRLAGWALGVVPAARVEHDYTFTKGDYKWYFLERNRWWTLLGAFPSRLLALLAPALLAFELVLLLAAWRGGWLGAKLRSQRDVLRALPEIRARRREVQATRAIAPRAFAGWLVAHLDSPVLVAATRIPGAEALTALYWRLVLAALR
jgi:GT2 family glycosyltransferase